MALVGSKAESRPGVIREVKSQRNNYLPLQHVQALFFEVPQESRCRSVLIPSQQIYCRCYNSGKLVETHLDAFLAYLFNLPKYQGSILPGLCC